MYIQRLLSSNARTLRSATLTTFAASVFFALASAQNPVPQVVGPPHPQAVAPGGGDFTLKVYGANFVPGAVVNWNRQPRATTYVSGHEVDVAILASDIASNTAGYITVTNPPPGGGVSSSSWSLVEVHAPTATLVPGDPIRYLENGDEVPTLLAADFNNDGILGLAVGSGVIHIDLGSGNGTFYFASNATYAALSGFGINTAAYGDFNGDGNLDLVYNSVYGLRGANSGMAVSLGNGNGTFEPGWQFINSGVESLGGSVVAGDFNRDGRLDLSINETILLGNGDGTFRVLTSYPKDIGFYTLLGDFNGDGILDLAIFQETLRNRFSIAIALGNGDGTFQPAAAVTQVKAGGCAFSPWMVVTDFNGDGKLDIAFCTDTSIGILLGNGDGTFQPPTYNYVSSTGEYSFAAGDFNSDGNTDLIVSDINHGLFTILLGNGDGTFQPRQRVNLPGPKNQGGEEGIVTGDFNSDGLLDFIFQLDAFGIGVYLQQ